MNTNIYTIEKCNNALLFNPDKICDLRENNRICGHLIGCLANDSRQNTYYGSPLLLSCEEAKLLVEHLKISNIYKEANVNGSIDDDADDLDMLKSNYENYLENFYIEQNLKCKEKRLNELDTLKTKIIEGKRKSLLNKIDKLKSQDGQNELLCRLNEELANIDKNNGDSVLCKEIKDLPRSDVQNETFLETPHFLISSKCKLNLYNETFLSITSSINYKYIIFKNLWSKGFYLTSGAKFGGDYLVYTGDPLLYHSKYILLCLNMDEYRNIKLKQLIHFGRMSSNVKKTFLLACVMCTNMCINRTNEDNVLFTCVNWSHI